MRACRRDRRKLDEKLTARPEGCQGTRGRGHPGEVLQEEFLEREIRIGPGGREISQPPDVPCSARDRLAASCKETGCQVLDLLFCLRVTQLRGQIVDDHRDQCVTNGMGARRERAMRFRAAYVVYLRHEGRECGRCLWVHAVPPYE